MKLFRICEAVPTPDAKPTAAPDAPKREDFFTYEVKPGDLK